MGFGFSTRNFLEFSTNNLQYVERGVISLGGKNDLPFIIIQKTNSLFNKENFIITPICFSGPNNFDISEFYEIVHEQLKSFKIRGGFIQTRDTLVPESYEIIFKWGVVFIDSRANYRFYLNDENDITMKMKRDSRLRVRKLLRNKNEFSLIKADSEYEINAFAKLYSDNARDNRYSKFYSFAIDSWRRLLKSDDFNLFLLRYKGKIVSGAIITTIDNAYDYTFMAYSNIINDISRANLYFIYKMLKDKGTHLDLGGGISENDSLAQFKLSMGGHPIYFNRYRFIFNSDNEIFNKDHIKYLMNVWP